MRSSMFRLSRSVELSWMLPEMKTLRSLSARALMNLRYGVIEANTADDLILRQRCGLIDLRQCRELLHLGADNDPAQICLAVIDLRIRNREWTAAIRRYLADREDRQAALGRLVDRTDDSAVAMRVDEPAIGPGQCVRRQPDPG